MHTLELEREDGGSPRFVIDAHSFLRGALFEGDVIDPAARCRRPLVVADPRRPLGQILQRLTVRREHPADDVIDEDVILVWAPGERRIITGADILGRLLGGIVRVTDAAARGGIPRMVDLSRRRR